MESIWKKEGEKEEMRGPLPKKREAVVLGGGMAGVLSACLLEESGIRTAVLEAEWPGSGQTKNTTAKITAQHGLIYGRLERERGARAAGQYARACMAAVEEYERIIRERGISCVFQRLPAFLYTNTEEGEKELAVERAAANRAGLRASLVRETGLPFPVRAALRFENQAQFSPLEFLNGVLEGLEVYSHTRALRVRGHEILTNRGSIQADHIIFATHFPFPNWPGLYFMKMHQERSYVLALRRDGGPELSGMYYGIDEDGLSLREAGDWYLVGGESHRTGESRRTGENLLSPMDNLRRRAREALGKEYEEAAAWAAQDCMTLDGISYIGQFSRLRPDWYVATGFQKWGMTGAMISAMAIRDQILGKETEDWEIFSPQRRPTWTTVKNLGKELFHGTKNLLTPGGPRCPHLGCQLKWNRAEHSWDCPCHGSRFSQEGRLMDNPAQKNLNQVENES